MLNVLEGNKSVAGGDWVGGHRVTDRGGRGVVPGARVDPIDPKLDGSIGGVVEIYCSDKRTCSEHLLQCQSSLVDHSPWPSSTRSASLCP